jgi:quercetin dioxygenase-like cupin family protein
MRLARWLSLLGLLVAIAAGVARGEQSVPGFISIQADHVPYQAVPDVAGVEYAVLSGDPDSAGIYVIRLRISPGLTFPPHFHDQDRHVSVVSGTWAFGTGDSGKCEDTVPLTAGAYVMHPKGAVHFDGSCGDQPVEVQIVGIGPVATTWAEKAE